MYVYIYNIHVFRVVSHFSIYLFGVAVAWCSTTILWKLHRPKWGFEQSKMKKQPSYILFKQCPRQFVDVFCCFCRHMAGVVSLPWSALALAHWRGWKAFLSPSMFFANTPYRFPCIDQYIVVINHTFLISNVIHVDPNQNLQRFFIPSLSSSADNQIQPFS